MSLTGLPVELLAIIIGEIADPFDVFNLARTCKYLHKTAERRLENQPHLREIYQTVCIKIASDRDCDGKIDKCHDFFMHPIEIMFELREDPDAAFHVEELHFHDHVYSTFLGQHSKLLLEQYNRDLRLPGFLDLENLMEERMAKNVPLKEQPDLFLFDLLLLIPNLRHLELYLYEQPVVQSKAFTSEFSKATGPPTIASKRGPFQKLNSITIHDRGFYCYDRLHLALATLPSVKNFYGSFLESPDWERYLPEVLCPAETVVIKSGSSGILDMFGGTRSLTFVLEADEPGFGWNLREIIQTLEYRVAETLEELRLFYGGAMTFIKNGTGSLHGLPNLRKINLDFGFMLPHLPSSGLYPEPDLNNIPRLVDVLPPSIREIKLSIGELFCAFKIFIRDFILLQPERLPNLETIWLDHPADSQQLVEAMSENSLKPWLRFYDGRPDLEYN